MHITHAPHPSFPHHRADPAPEPSVLVRKAQWLGGSGAVDMEPGSPSPGQPYASGFGLVLDADLIDGAHFPSPGLQFGDLLADLGHPSGDRGFIAALVEGVGKLEAHTGGAHEQLVGGVGGALRTEFYLHHVVQGRHIPEVRLDVGL